MRFIHHVVGLALILLAVACAPATANPQAKKLTYDQVVDRSILDEIEKEGFIKQVYGR